MELKGKLALIVDDEEFLREIISDELQRRGVTVIEAANGEEAFKLFKQHAPEVIVTDVRMPGGNGIDLLKRVKECNVQMPVVLLMTAYSDYTDEQIFDIGADALYSKPFKPKVLVAGIEKCLMSLKERLTQKNETFDTKAIFNVECTSLEEARIKGEINFGRGGMFLALNPDSSLSVKDYVKFKITILNQNIVAEGVGLCRWIRRQNINDLRAGCGIEVVELNNEAIDTVFCDLDKKQPFIPRS